MWFLRLFFTERGELSGGEAVRRLLRHAWHEMYGCAMPEIVKTPAGKPFFSARPDVFFSISHTKTHVLAALGEHPVGADVETVRPVRHGISRRVGTDAEISGFGFFPLWSLKESYIKLFGEPLPMSALRFERDGCVILTPRGDVSAQLYDSVPGCAAAVCVLCGTPPENTERVVL